MTQEETLDYNKLCAEFLGYVNTTQTDKDFNIYHNEKGMIIGNKIHTMIEPMSAKFHSDWNWIMEVVEAIEKLKNKDGYRWQILIQDVHCVIEESNKIFNSNQRVYSNTKKEAVVQAINQFLIWYNKQTL